MTPEGPAVTEYYTSTSRKIGDFCLGFFAVYLAVVVVYLPIGFLIGAWEMPEAAWVALPVVLLIAAIAGIVVFIRRHRHYIAMGIVMCVIFTMILPLLAVGACFAILATTFNQGGFF